MSEQTTPKQPSRGAGPLPARIGLMQVGQPFWQWGYITPRYPFGINATDLQAALPPVQRETVMVWFALNFETYDLRKGGPYIGFGRKGSAVWGEGTFAPSPLSAVDILLAEFGETIPHVTLREIAEEIPGQWMHRTNLGPITPPVPSSGEVFSLLRSEFARFESIIRELGTRSVDGMGPDMRGHNNPPEDDAPLTGGEKETVLTNIGKAKEAIAEGTQHDIGRLKAAWSNISPIMFRLGPWIIKQVDNFGTNFSTEAGKSLGNAVGRPQTILWLSGAAGAWHVAQHINALITKLLEHWP